MKISLVAVESGWHGRQLVESAKKFNVELSQVNIKDLNDLKTSINSLGDVILWRSASIETPNGRTAFLSLIKDKHIINETIFKLPFIGQKLFQQKYVEKYAPNINHIQTYQYETAEELLNAVKAGVLKYPFIQKPNAGSKGNGVSLIASQADIDTQDIQYKKFIYQNFIKNTGDFRVFMIGGKVLGVMKRIAQDGSFLNNVSKGGTAVQVTDNELVEKIGDIGATIASLFNFTMCGVDVIYNEEDGQYYFLEVNTAPQWEGFQGATGINVADEIVKLCIALGNRERKSTFENVKSYYDDNFDFLGKYKLHYAQRTYLWTKDEKFKPWLEEYKASYLGEHEVEVSNNFKAIIDREKSTDDGTKTAKRALRQSSFHKYPKLSKYLSILFKNSFSKSIYGENLRHIIKDIIPDEDFIRLYNDLYKDKEAIQLLSTHAINYFYLLENYFDGEGIGKNLIDPQYFHDIAEEMEHSKETFQLKIYLLTHCIIGESRFYSRKIERNYDVYVKILKLLEKLIYNHYFEVSLDNKFEFLVCCKICNCTSSLETLINQEADRSYAVSGNFLIDTLNDKTNKLGRKMGISEHRNMLFIMSNSAFN